MDDYCHACWDKQREINELQTKIEGLLARVEKLTAFVERTAEENLWMEDALVALKEGE